MLLLGMKKTKGIDVNQIAARIVAEATTDPEVKPEKKPAAVALGRLGGLKGGKARAESLTAKKRTEIAQKAAKARWGKRDRLTGNISLPVTLSGRTLPCE